MDRLIISGYGVAELNKVASRITGELEAQAILESTTSALENGMIVYVDAAENEVVLTKTSSCVDAPYLHFSNVRLYEDGKSGMKNFRYERSTDYLPRLYKLTAGDIFTTNVIAATDFTYEGFATATGGIITAVISGETGEYYIKPTTMPDGSKGFEVRYLG